MATLNNIAHSLENKSILITGCTGFLAKSNESCLSLSLSHSSIFVCVLVYDWWCSIELLVNIAVFVEKILRVQPQVKRLYLLVRASDAKSAKHRVDSQVIYILYQKETRCGRSKILLKQERIW